MATMLESERKEWNKYKLIMAAITVLLILITYAGLFNFNLYEYQKATGGIWSTIGLVSLCISLLPLLFERRLSRATKNESLWFIIWFVGLLIGLLLACSSEL